MLARIDLRMKSRFAVFGAGCMPLTYVAPIPRYMAIRHPRPSLLGPTAPHPSPNAPKKQAT